jgi:hypothetical protein
VDRPGRCAAAPRLGSSATEGLPESIGDIEETRVNGRKAIVENNRIVEYRMNTRITSVVKGHG